MFKKPIRVIHYKKKNRYGIIVENKYESVYRVHIPYGQNGTDKYVKWEGKLFSMGGQIDDIPDAENVDTQIFLEYQVREIIAPLDIEKYIYIEENEKDVNILRTIMKSAQI